MPGRRAREEGQRSAAPVARKAGGTTKRSDIGAGYELDEGGRWMEKDRRDRWLFKRGQMFNGEYLDDVSTDDRGVAYIRWILDTAQLRPSPAEELAMREAIGEVGSVNGKMPQADGWTNIIVGSRSFRVPEQLAAAFEEEIDRLRLITATDVAAFEAMIANSSTTPLESLV